MVTKRRCLRLPVSQLERKNIVVPIEHFVRLRRPYEAKAACSWIRDARDGKVPGAFQFGGRGRWYVCLDIYDEEVRKLSTPKKNASADDDKIAQVARLLSIDEAHLTALKSIIEG